MIISGYVLSATTGGAMSWVAQSGGASDLNGLSDCSTSNTTGTILSIDNSSGNKHTTLGQGAGNALTTGGDANTAIGRDALYSVSTADFCTAVGENCLRSTTGQQNTAVGYQSLFSNTIGKWNSAFGTQALYENIDGISNTAIGFKTMNSNLSGARNTAVGFVSLVNNQTGNGNAINDPNRDFDGIIDEISMFHSYRLDTVDKICKLARGNTEPFGDLQVILCGDFFQLPPINDKDYPIDSFAYKADVWNELKIKTCYLNEQHRQWDEQFLKLLNDIRSQDLNESTYENLSSRLNLQNVDDITPTKLYTHNIDVDSMNDKELKNIDKQPQVYKMVSKGDKKLVDSLKKGCLAPETLILKKGAKVIFIKNNPQNKDLIEKYQIPKEHFGIK